MVLIPNKGGIVTHIIRYDTQTEEGLVKSVYVDIRDWRLLLSWSDTNWYTKGKKRLIPVWWDKKGLFIFRLAIRMGFVDTDKKKTTKEVETHEVS